MESENVLHKSCDMPSPIRCVHNTQVFFNIEPKLSLYKNQLIFVQKIYVNCVQMFLRSFKQNSCEPSVKPQGSFAHVLCILLTYSDSQRLMEFKLIFYEIKCRRPSSGTLAESIQFDGLFYWSPNFYSDFLSEIKFFGSLDIYTI